ncbi:hypothetical protein HII12_003320 [Brettanomyces bruxellensis]|uniref:Uncharacterized protein n=1 Tax=Dekkera bruxellensis TaxID=5007 RepID=A0A8H6ETI6_DEKBR|nr:hypothetical protein HII12_003320 [Brettanomyces bruxellensis]
MPINYIANLIVKGPENTAGWKYIRKLGPPALLITLLKLYFNGSNNTWQRDLHGKVYMITGGTSGIGSELVKELAQRGAQLVLLTSQLEKDNSGAVWITDYVDDLRDATGNPLIYVEQCDLSSLYSVRKFATKWLDNRVPRRLDGIICLASERVPPGKQREVSTEGVEKQLAVNYLGHYHLLTLLIPAIKSQPIDRDVRIAVGTVDLDDLLWENKLYPSRSPWKVYGSSKLMLHMFAKEFQRRLDEEYKRRSIHQINIGNKKVKKGKNAKKVKKGKKEEAEGIENLLKEKINGLSNADRNRLFRSVFDDSKDVYPDMKHKDLTEEQESARNILLKKLDEKYEASRKKVPTKDNSNEKKSE